MLKDLKIGTQVGLGFALVLLVMVLAGYHAIDGLRTSGEGFKSYRHLARDSILSGRVQANMLMASKAAKDFIKTRDVQAEAAFNERFESAQRFALEQRSEMADPQRQLMSQELVEGLATYREVVSHVFADMRTRDVILEERLNPQGRRMRELLTEIMASAFQDDDSEAAYLAGRALGRVLVGRLYVLKFIDANKDADVERVRIELGSGFESSLEDMLAAIDNPRRMELLREFREARAAYLVAFEEIVTTIQGRNTMIATQLDPLDRRIADRAEQIKLSIKEEQDLLGPAIQASDESTEQTVLLAAAFAVVLAVGIAWLIIRATTRPIASLVETVDEVQSSGDLSVRSGIRSADEIGSISSSLNAFLDSLEAKVGAIREVSSGNLEVDIPLASKRDLLAIAMNQMISTLKEVSRQADVIATGDYSADISPRRAEDSLGIALQEMTSRLRQSALQPPSKPHDQWVSTLH